MSTPSIEHIYSNCVRVDVEEGTYLFSYNSPIFHVVGNRIMHIFKDYDYSRTTSKHVNYFIDSCGSLYLGEHDLTRYENRKRKQLLDDFYLKQEYDK
jgi:hypothetical protein